MKKLLAPLAALALLLTGCSGGTFDGYVHAECDATETQAAGKVTECRVTEKPVPTATATVTVPGPTVTQTVPGPTQTVTVTPAPAPTTTAAPAPTTASPSPTATASTEVRFTGYVTGYSYYTNDPPRSRNIAYEDVVKTRTGAGGTGTFEDPITTAVRNDTTIPIAQRHKPGDKFYVPNLRRYFIAEDLCTVSWSAPNGCEAMLDVWVDGQNHPESVSHNCMYSDLTKRDTFIIKNPVKGYAVTPGTLSDNCTKYGNTVVMQ
jgi:hypothetical protein